MKYILILFILFMVSCSNDNDFLVGDVVFCEEHNRIYIVIEETLYNKDGKDCLLVCYKDSKGYMNEEFVPIKLLTHNFKEK